MDKDPVTSELLSEKSSDNTLNSHSKDKNKKSFICEKEFPMKSSLNIHHRMHTDKPTIIWGNMSKRIFLT